jgi:hypothetical protein
VPAGDAFARAARARPLRLVTVLQAPLPTLPSGSLQTRSRVTRSPAASKALDQRRVLPPETLRNAHVDVVLREAEMCRAAWLASDAHARLGVQQAHAACGHDETLRLGRAVG